jgi:hypothetical protein
MNMSFLEATDTAATTAAVAAPVALAASASATTIVAVAATAAATTIVPVAATAIAIAVIYSMPLLHCCFSEYFFCSCPCSCGL